MRWLAFQGAQHMVIAMSAMIKKGGCFLPPGRDYSETLRPSPSMRQDGLARTLSMGWKGLASQVVCWEGPLRALSGEHDPLEEPRAPAWLQRELWFGGVYSRPLAKEQPKFSKRADPEEGSPLEG